MKHKHADLIHAWADGAEIQEWYDGRWIDSDPSWYDYVEYRIKPEEKKPVVRWLWATQWHRGGEWKLSREYLTEDELQLINTDPTFNSPVHVKLEWSLTEFPE